MICCPTGTCDNQSIANNLLPLGDDVFLEPTVDVIDQAPYGNNSPAVNQDNYPIFFNFLKTVPSSEVGPIDQQVEEPVPVPHPPDFEEQVGPVDQQVDEPVPVPPNP